ncbi:MAG: hypothetical protein JO075_08370 [Acidimicrobiia bacterium]|nr:hypothetical protein [Acidimicrobiia bacterium]
MSFLLVLAAAVTLVIGLLNSGLGLIYVSIGCSVAAGIVLALAVVRSRPERAAAPAVGSERLRALEEEESPTVTVVPSRGGRRKAADVPEEEEEEVEIGASGDGEGVFPIADYDDLKVGEIVSLLPELDEDELEMVREREEAGKNRSTILTRVEALSGAAAAAPAGGGDWGVSERSWDSWSDGGGEEEAEEEEVEVEGEGIFPIADYDDLKAAEVVSLLPELDDDELEEVRDREERGAARATVLNRIDQLLGVEPAPVKKAPAKKKAATKKAPAKKPPAKKAPAKKTAAKKTTTKKATAKKTTAKRTTAKRTTAKKS